MPELAVPDKIDHYHVIGKLGEGGMGVVYLAEDKRLHREVAIKCLKPDNRYDNSSDNSNCNYKNNNVELSYRLRQEARLLAQLNHQNIVQIFDILDYDDNLFLVMEYVNGQTLRGVMREKNTDLRQRIEWLQQITEGLSAAHELNIIHRDLKEDNILIDQNNVAKISDFGIAKSVGNDSLSYTNVGNVLGSYGSMSPEQALGKRLDSRSDLFSLGILAFKLIYRQHPFGNSCNHNVLVQNIINQSPTDPSVFSNNVPDALNHLILSLLAKKPEDRPSSARKINQILLGISDSIDGDSIDDGSIETNSKSSELNQTIDIHYPMAITAVRGSRRSAITPVSLIALILVAISFVLMYLNHANGSHSYVAILPPTFKVVNLLPATREKNLTSVVYSALQQGVINSEGLFLINKNETELFISKDTNNMKGLGKALAADYIIQTTLDCDSVSCDIIISKLSKDTLAERWSVEDQKVWPVVVDGSYLRLSEMIEQQLYVIFKHYPKRFENSYNLSEKRYLYYLDLYVATNQVGSDYKALLHDLEENMGQFTSYPPIYDLYRFLSLKQFDDTGDERYLDLLEERLRVSDALFPQHPTQLNNWFNLALYRKDKTLAMEIVEKLKQVGADNATVYRYHAEVNAHFGNNTEAINYYKKALKLRPTVGGLYNLALSQWQVGDYDSAHISLDNLLQLSPNDYEGLQLSAHLSLTSGQLDLAIRSYIKAADINPQSQNYNNMGLAYELDGQYFNARTAFIKATTISPTLATAWLNLADIEKLLGNAELAKPYYEKVISLHNNDDSWVAVRNLSQAYAHIGEFEKSIQLLQKGLALSSDNFEMLFNAALIYTLVGEYTSALVFIDKSIEQGVERIWFALPWFDVLCQSTATHSESFSTLLDSKVHPIRCP